MLNYSTEFAAALPYGPFLQKFGTPEQQHRWNDFRESVRLSDEQQALLKSFTREMKVLVLAGAWCGDCVNQCPIFDRFAEANPKIQVRFADRDEHSALAKEITICGGARVPSLVFLSEDGFVCGRAGDRTLSKYRSIVANLGGAACPTGLATPDDLTASVVEDWLNEFERVQWMLRTSSRLREKHRD